MADISQIKLPNETTYDIKDTVARTGTVETSRLVRPTKLNGVIDNTIAPQIDDLRANRLAFLPADQIIIEKTTDGGTTWTDAGVSDATKLALFSQTRPGVYIPLLNGQKNILCGLRVTFTAMKYNVPSNTAETQKYNYWNSNYVKSTERYNQLREMYFWVSSNTDSIKVKLERATGAKPNNWIVLFDRNDYGMTGWGGNDYISFSQGVFGGGTTQTGNYWNYRLTFFTAGPNGSSTLSGNNMTSAQSISEIRGYGTTWWTAGNKFAASDHMYSWDSAQNVTFPNKVTANGGFAGSGASLTSLNANNLSSGTVPVARLPVATSSTNGIMTSTEKNKLAGIAEGATANTGTITGITMNGASKGTSGVVNLGTIITAHQDVSGKLDTSLKGAANGVAPLDATQKVPLVNLPVMTGATDSAAGTSGLVPSSNIGDQNKVLLGSGIWGTIPILIESPLANVSNTLGAYTHTTVDSRITTDMKCVLLELGNPSAFKAKVVITPGNGEVTLSCADVEGESTVVASFMKVDVRNFTVTFGKEEEDGGDVLETKILPFRSIPEYTGETPTTTRFSDDYYMFDGWNPAIAPVSGDNVYKVKFLNLLVARYLGSGVTTYESDTDTAIGSGAFYGMTGLTSVKSTATTVEANAFDGCTSLETIDLTNPTGVVSLNATGMPESVTSIVIWSDTVGTLTGTLPTQFTEGTGIIYVTDELLSNYKTNWSTYASHIYPIRAYPVRNMSDTIMDNDEIFFRKLADGTGASEYNIGDTKTLDLGSEGNIQFVITAKDADELADGTGHARLTITSNTALKTNYKMNATAKSIDGWKICGMRTYLKNTIWPLLPESLRANIKTVKKYSDIYNASETLVHDDMTEDDIWLLSAREVGAGHETIGPVYNFFTSNSRSKKDINGNSVLWWLRTAYSKNQYYRVMTSGNPTNYAYSNGNSGIIFGFCV